MKAFPPDTRKQLKTELRSLLDKDVLVVANIKIDEGYPQGTPVLDVNNSPIIDNNAEINDYILYKPIAIFYSNLTPSAYTKKSFIVSSSALRFKGNDIKENFEYWDPQTQTLRISSSISVGKYLCCVTQNNEQPFLGKTSYYITINEPNEYVIGKIIFVSTQYIQVNIWL